MKLVLLAKIEALVLENHSNAATSLLLTPVMPTTCSGTLPSCLTDGASQPHQAHGCADQCQQAPGVVYPVASSPLCLLGSPPILSCSVCSCKLLSGWCSSNFGLAFVPAVRSRPFPLEDSLPCPMRGSRGVLKCGFTKHQAQLVSGIGPLWLSGCRAFCKGEECGPPAKSHCVYK